MKQVAFLGLVLLASGCFATFQRCSLSDPNLNQCLSQSIFQAIHVLAQGNEHLGVPQLEPFTLGSFAFESFAPNYHLDSKYTNYVIHGLSHLTSPPQVQFDRQSLTLIVEFPFPELLYEWDMNYIGQIYQYRTDVTGRGRKTHRRNFRFTFKLYKTVIDDGQEHYKVLDADLLFPPATVGTVVYQYETIPGSSITGAQLTQLYNQYRDLVTRAVTHEYELTLATVAHEIFDNILERIPANQLFAP